jgi:hypothetical protein
MELALNINYKLKALVVGGVIAGATAIWHLLMIAGGPSWYAFGHAPPYIVESAKQNTFIAPIAAVIIASLMFACTAYSFSGAGLIRKIPLLKSALVTISIICLARALVTVPVFLQGRMDTWNLVASFGWFFVGVCYLIGAIEQFRRK